jgi:hypothetical protein
MFYPLGPSLTAMVTNLSKVFITLTVVLAGSYGIHAGLAPHVVTTDIQWLHYVDANLPEQDVFIERYGAHSNAFDPDYIGAREIFVPNLFRVESKSALTPSVLAQPVYAAAALVPHDPLQLGPNSLGPYYKGEALGFTLGQWLAARGSGTYTQTDNHAELMVVFQNLVPDGRYSLWCDRMSATPDYSEVERPCGAADGSQNRFRSDAQGNLSVHLNLNALPIRTPAFTTVLLLTYEHSVESSDGEWGGYGLSSHVQLFYAFPVSTNAVHDCRGQSLC